MADGRGAQAEVRDGGRASSISTGSRHNHNEREAEMRLTVTRPAGMNFLPLRNLLPITTASVPAAPAVASQPVSTH